MKPIQLEDRAMDAMLSEFQGEIILPESPEYDNARRVWNGMIDKYPKMIVRPTSVEDVIVVVNFIRELALPVAVRGGGHNVAGHATCDDGVVIDLAQMKQIEVDSERRTARAQGGVTWGELDAATQQYGLATPGGVFSKTGIAGLTLGGGFGWLRSPYGLSCDNLIGAEVVLADGSVVNANATQNQDLLWALRGGGGNFGIVTTFEYQLHPVGPEVAFAFAFHPADDEAAMREAVRFFRDYCASVPNEVSTIAALGVIPPEPELFPVELHGRFFVLFGGLYAGDPAEGERLLQPLREWSTPLIDASGIKPYVEAQQAFDADYPGGKRYYWKSINLNRLDDEVIARLVKHARQQPSPYSTTDLWDIRGAVKRGSDSAFNGRQAAFLLNPEANWEHAGDDALNLQWVRDFVDDMQAFSDGSRYLNFPGFQEEGDEMMRTSFGANYERLAQIKTKYDPNNLFRLNQNVKPKA
jgi:FAD/FMN-containing dehydrogenase